MSASAYHSALAAVVAGTLLTAAPEAGGQTPHKPTVDIVAKTGMFSAASPEAAAAGVRVRGTDLPAILRFEIGDAQRSGDLWSIEFSTPSGRTALRAMDLPQAFVYGRVVEIPVTSAGMVTVAFSDRSAPPVHYVALVRLASSGRPLFVNGPEQLETFDAGVPVPPDENSRLRANSRAVVQVRYASPTRRDRSTGFQIAAGLFLTNLHAVSNAYGALEPEGKARLYFGTFEGDLDRADAIADARIVATGQASPNNERWPLDYAVLAAGVPAGYAAAILPLAARQSGVRLNDRLELYTLWYGRPVGKKLSRDDECRVTEIFELPDDSSVGCLGSNFLHRCDTEAGSSGSPVLHAGTRSVVGLHYFGIRRNSGNCALGVGAILDDIQKRYPAVWAELNRRR